MDTEKDIKSVLIRDISKKESDSINEVKKLSGKGSATKALLWAAENIIEKMSDLDAITKKYNDIIGMVKEMDYASGKVEFHSQQIKESQSKLKELTKKEPLPGRYHY
jgi:methyl-accepting chemotaxis protein